MSAPRRPTQRRAHERRESLLDAAATILDRDGWEALTTRALATEAGAAIGTVYDYFRNRDAVLVGLLERYQDRMETAIDGALDSADVVGSAGRAVDTLAHFWKHEPGYHAAWLATQSGVVEAAGKQWTELFTARISDALAPWIADPQLRQRVARTAVNLVTGLLLGALATPAQDWEALVEETKVALLAYLAARIGAPPQPPSRQSPAAPAG